MLMAMVSNVALQTMFPVPEGVLKHRRKNSLGLSLWTLNKEGAKICQFEEAAGGADGIWRGRGE